ncbi:MAG TPA: citrate transporter [Rhodocyclaceae bacterium]|nr:citrate transporter [Rhodocyclaceae bacterium]
MFFAATLLGVAIFHAHTLRIALVGLIATATYKVLVSGFKAGEGLQGLAAHLTHEWVVLANLFCMLTGFAILSRHFEKSHLPVIMPRYLPSGRLGAFALLAIVWFMSGFLDNIVAAMIGGAMAHQLFQSKVHVGYLAAIVAASNAGGAGSVVGDTTTTMLWISGVSPLQVAPAYLAGAVALLVVGVVASRQQHAHWPMLRHSHMFVRVDRGRLGIVGSMLMLAIATNVVVNSKFPELADSFPFLGVALWSAIFLTMRVRRHDWEVLPEAAHGSLFLLALVLCASMMPVEKLPAASGLSTLGLGFVSSVFDNIPLTELAIKQGGYDWALLAYAVGFGGSMVWFGSSAGIAISNMYPQARSVGLWLRHGWHVPLAYLAGFGVMLAVLGWNPA